MASVDDLLYKFLTICWSSSKISKRQREANRSPSERENPLRTVIMEINRPKSRPACCSLMQFNAFKRLQKSLEVKELRVCGWACSSALIILIVPHRILSEIGRSWPPGSPPMVMVLQNDTVHYRWKCELEARGWTYFSLCRTEGTGRPAGRGEENEDGRSWLQLQVQEIFYYLNSAVMRSVFNLLRVFATV